ncbi:MAG: BPL-N domain-containing protein [Thermodesulfovibrionales bacterium]|jgi:hypothetical protein|nr:BPL-N domain-containing protein [Thermodesulfovibrionales bacterium]
MKTKNKVAFLWDESFLWGLMAYKALKACNLSFELIRSDDIKNGELKNYRMLFVPGGWASNKMKTLGEEGISEIKNFVNSGGNYLGFCGGAGLATLDGIGLLNIKRMPTKQRVPSFSGRIHLNINGHPIWNSSLHHSITPSAIFHAWWPSQFLIDDKTIKILATYGDALPDSFSSDLNVGDVEANGGWSELEDIYKINLDPTRLKNEPAVVEDSYGKGKVILSLIHFDTPDDENGARVLKNLWQYLAERCSSTTVRQCNIKNLQSSACSLQSINEIESLVADMINLGTRNFLWFWRNPMLLQWRRGVRGLEYCTLYAMIKEIAEIIKKQKSEVRSQKSDLNKIKELLMPFAEKAKQLLILERYAMQNRHITYKKCNDPEIQEMRTELFGNSKSHGGLFKKLIDEVDNVLYALIKNKEAQ